MTNNTEEQKDTDLSPAAGRTLDALVAERMGKVFRWTNTGQPLIDVVPPMYGAASHMEALPYYSTQISAAWELVEKAQAKGYEPIVRYDTVIGDWVANIVTNRHYQSYKSFNASANTAPHAICLAYLALTDEVK
jgi:hypothetical protein